MQDLNVWILEFSDDGLNGYATFPWDFSDDPYIDGVVISKYTLPMERTNRNYQELRSVGITLTHETGHWLGLFHTFQVSVHFEGLACSRRQTDKV